MDIYSIHINGIKYKQFKNYEDAYKIIESIIIDSPKFLIEIILEQYCEFGYSDTSCKFFSLYKYDNGNIAKNYVFLH